jgi:hypothetical protein
LVFFYKIARFLTAFLLILKRINLCINVNLFKLDGDGLGYLKCGAFQGAYSTVDFGVGANVTEAFGYQRVYAPEGPLVYRMKTYYFTNFILLMHLIKTFFNRIN